MGKRGFTILALALFLLAAVDSPAAVEESRLMRYPDIHGDMVVFTYGGDIWTVPSSGGAATRLTTHTGGEGFAKFSPDGETIAFTGMYDGNSDIYSIPVTGGVPRRLTYHSFPDFVIDWHPKGNNVLFRSFRESKTNPGPRYMKLYTIGTEGGYPQALPLFEGGLASYSPDGTKIAYNRLSREFRTWKRYKGGMAQDIWLYDLEKNESAKLTEFEGTDAFPMWYGENKIYFISDREHTMNIYCLELDSRKITKITNHREYDVKWPSIGGDSIVYENGGFLYILDLKTDKSARIKITVPSDHSWRRPRYVNASRHIRYFNLSSTGKRAIFGARGDIFTVPAEKGEVRNLTNTPGIRERSPTYSPDGKWVAYLSDKSGEYEIYTIKSDGTSEENQITSGLGHYPWLIYWSPDSKKLLFHDETYQLYYVDIEAKKVVVIDEDPLWDIGSYSWAADSKWIAYAKNNELGYSSIHLYNVDEDRSHKVTGDMYNDYNPFFDPGGKYLYFVSDRSVNFSFHNVEFDIKYETPSVICAVTLKADTPSPLAPESDEVEVKEDEEEKDDEEKKEEKAEDKGDEEENKDDGKEEEEEEDKGFEIDLEGFESRIVTLPVGTGNFIGLVGLEGKLLYAQYSAPPMTYGPPNGQFQAAINYFDLKERESKTVISGITGYDVSADGKKLIYAARGQYGIIDIAPGKKVGDGKISTNNLRMKIDPLEEWKQIFNEAWRMERDFFYVENMHGVNWKKIKKRYEELLPYLTNRDDLNYIIGEMIAELNIGHAYVGGGDYYPRSASVSNGKLGCDFEIDKKSGRYRFSKIYKGRNWEPLFKAPLNQPGIDISEGDYLLAINGVDLKYPTNPFELLENTVGHQTVLKVSKDKSDEEAKDIVVVPVGNDINLRYEDWVEGNRQKCLAASDGKIGYVHVPSTAITGLYEFGRQYFPQADMDGIVIDVRYNSGGWMPSLFVDRLSKELKSLWGSRYGMVRRFPMTAPVGHLACVINEYAGSGGDAFPYMFRQAGLGPLIGKRTWGGLVGMNRNIPMVDGGYVTVPTIGFMDTDAEYDVEGFGVAPDIEVENMPDEVVSGKDPQLEKAIEYIMNKIAEDPPKKIWKKPVDPDKS
jgi:tricorn protease